MKHFFVAGFDFGTSCSKVVLRDQLTGAGKAVTFGQEALGLLPSVVHIGTREVCGPLSPHGVPLYFPKLIAADCAAGSDSFSDVYSGDIPRLARELGATDLKEFALTILAGYFLSVITAVRRFLENDPDWKDFDPGSDPLVTQLAVPSGLMDQRDGAVDDLMKKALRIAMLLFLRGEESESLTIERFRQAQMAAQGLSAGDKESLEDRCVTYPEVAAGVQTIFRSRNTPDGKYITMDVGAGTVDMNAFYRRSSRESREGYVDGGLDYWACDVRPLGAARLAHRLDTVREQESTCPTLTRSDLVTRLDKALRLLMRNAFRYQPTRVAGNGPSPWSHQTHVYIWGGGAAYREYGDTLAQSLRKLGIPVEQPNQLPRPLDDFQLPSDVENFGRLAIAYGLSFHSANLEAVRLPFELSPFVKARSTVWTDRLDQTKICHCHANPACARCHGTGFIRIERDIAAPFIVFPTQTPAPRRISSHEKAIKECMRRYNHLNKNGRRFLVAERLELLNRIHQLTKRPEVQADQELLSDARFILLHNMKLFGGRVRIRTLSGKRSASGCRVVVRMPRPAADIDLEIEAPNPDDFEKAINEFPPEFVDVGCGIRKTDRGEFRLAVTNLKPNVAERRSY